MKHTRSPITAGRRLGVVTADQAISGGSNILAAIVAARVLSPASFGLFGLVFLVFGLVQGVFRSAICTPVLMQPAKTRAQVEMVVGATWLFGLVSSLVLVAAALAGFIVQPELAGGLFALAACIPLIMIQDLTRYLSIGLLRPGYALWLDAGWLILFIIGAVVLVGGGQATLVTLLAVWAGSGALTGLGAIAIWAPLRSARPGLGWLAANWHLSWRFTGSYGAAQLSTVILAFIIRALLGSATLGALLGAQILMRPYGVFETALFGSGVAEISNSAGGRVEISRQVNRVTVMATGVAVANAVVMAVLPAAIGIRLLGQTWPHTQPLLIPFAVQLIALGLAIGPRVGLVGVGRINLTFIISVAFGPVLLVAATAGAALAGAGGCAWAMSASWFGIDVIWWIAFLRARERLVG